MFMVFSIRSQIALSLRLSTCCSFGRSKDDLRFEDQNWWIHQVQQLLNFYLEAQFKVVEGESINFKNFRTDLSSEGKKQDGVQNLDTIS
jgi:hypothetical protein